MPQSKEQLKARGKAIMALAQQYRAQHPTTQWKTCVAMAGKIYKNK